jgi:hypothetical protein
VRKIITRIAFEFNEEMLSSDDREITMTDQEMLRYAAQCFTEDIEQMVKYNELFSVALAQTNFVTIGEVGTNNL